MIYKHFIFCNDEQEKSNREQWSLCSVNTVVVPGHVARVSYLLNTTFSQVPRYRIQAQCRPVPKWKVETLCSGPCVHTVFFCFLDLGSSMLCTRCQAHVSKWSLTGRNGVSRSRLPDSTDDSTVKGTRKHERVVWEKGSSGGGKKEVIERALRRPFSPQFPPVLFSCSRFLNFADTTISEPKTG